MCTHWGWQGAPPPRPPHGHTARRRAVQTRRRCGRRARTGPGRTCCHRLRWRSPPGGRRAQPACGCYHSARGLPPGDTEDHVWTIPVTSERRRLIAEHRHGRRDSSHRLPRHGHRTTPETSTRRPADRTHVDRPPHRSGAPDHSRRSGIRHIEIDGGDRSRPQGIQRPEIHGTDQGQPETSHGWRSRSPTAGESSRYFVPSIKPSSLVLQASGISV